MSDGSGSIQRVVFIAFVLAAVSFVLMLVYGPVEARRPGQGGAFVPSSVEEQAVRIRRALVSGRADAAVAIAQETVNLFPDERETWLWAAQIHHTLGSPDLAVQAGRRLEALTVERGEPSQPLSRSRYAYRLGWAHQTTGRAEAARAFFLEAARLYEEAPPGLRPDDGIAYNMACYLAMAGESDRAALEFARAVDAGYGGDEGWWRADPDLNPIREHPVFIAAAEDLATWEADRRSAAPRGLGPRRRSPEPEAGPTEPDA